jgi:hypothetical protein
MTCPCESGLAPSACCRRSGGGWHKAPEAVEPVPPPTGFSHPKCYLRESRNCSQTLENEHYFSAVALKTIDLTLRVSGFPWVKGDISKAIPIEQFTSRVLCSRHNRALSPIDTQGGRFVRWIRDFCNSSAPPPRARVLFSGHDLERWCLKTFLGFLAAGVLQSSPGQAIRRVNVSPQVIDLFFGRVADEWGRGLWVRTDPQRPVSTELALSLSPMCNQVTGGLFGLTFNFFGFDFACSTAPIALGDSVFRPSHLKFHRPGGLCTIELSWALGVPHSGPVEWDWVGQNAPKPTSSNV